jgi:hypothetical protein
VSDFVGVDDLSLDLQLKVLKTLAKRILAWLTRVELTDRRLLRNSESHGNAQLIWLYRG